MAVNGLSQDAIKTVVSSRSSHQRYTSLFNVGTDTSLSAPYLYVNVNTRGTEGFLHIADMLRLTSTVASFFYIEFARL